jgi:hypothetical protein
LFGRIVRNVSCPGVTLFLFSLLLPALLVT